MSCSTQRRPGESRDPVPFDENAAKALGPGSPGRRGVGYRNRDFTGSALSARGQRFQRAGSV